jgi:hypothetical protein
MINLKEFYIIGEPIDTPIGKCEFIRIKDYPTYFMDLQIMSWSKREILFKYLDSSKDDSIREFIEELKKLTLYQIAFNIPEIKQAYFNVFLKVFGDTEIVDKITDENFADFRSLILSMNCQKEEVISANPEIQAAIERSKRVKALESGKLEFADISSSIVVSSGGINYRDLADMTIYQFYMTYHRIAQFKNYDTSTLFATVSSEKSNIESWSKHIDLFEDENHSISKDEMNNKTNSLFGNRSK